MALPDISGGSTMSAKKRANLPDDAEYFKLTQDLKAAARGLADAGILDQFEDRLELGAPEAKAGRDRIEMEWTKRKNEIESLGLDPKNVPGFDPSGPDLGYRGQVIRFEPGEFIPRELAEHITPAFRDIILCYDEDGVRCGYTQPEIDRINPAAVDLPGGAD